MKYYCLGIKGAGMATLACLLHDLGHTVIGYDDVEEWKFTQKGLDERNIKIYYNSLHELEKDVIVTYSKAFSLEHKELIRVKKLGLKIKAYNEIIGDITKEFKTISVSGTHGKTTTSSIISHIIDNTLGCNYFIGDGRGKGDKDNELFVIESDEFNRHFLAYNPTISVVTNMELEHTECYSDLNDIINTFQKFLNNTKELAVLCGDNENVRKLSFSKKIIYYGFDDNNNFMAKNIKVTDEYSSFDVYKDHDFYESFSIPLFGNHMILNSLACIAVCDYLNIDKDKIKELFLSFHNAERRFSEKKIGDVVVIDDYAHHPTEIKVTLEAAKTKYPDKTLIAIFKPNTYSRTKDFYKEFGQSLSIANQVYVTEIDCNREKASDYPGVSSQLILNYTNNGKKISEDSIDELLKYDNAVICFMSCASISHLKEKYEQAKEV